MRVHFILFRWGKSDMPRLGVQESSDTRPVIVFDFANKSRNPAVRALRDLCARLWPAEIGIANPWFLVNHRLEVEQPHWSDAVWKSLRGALLGATAGMWRRWIVHFDMWPYKLASVFDPRSTQADRDACLQTFWSCNWCCFDPLMARRFRLRCRTREDVLEPKTIHFMRHMFNSIPLSIAWVETQFAHIKQWLLKSPRPMSMSLLSSKFFCHHLKTLHNSDPRSASKEARSHDSHRPVWVKQAKRRTGENVFVHGP